MKNIVSIILCFVVVFFATASADTKISPKLMLAKTYPADAKNFTIEDYWISEKFDGVRAYWNGEKFVSRRGNIFHAPDWFIGVLPKTPMDGELWISRGQFEKLSGIVRRQSPLDSDWRNIKFMVFDLPSLSSNFDERLSLLRGIIKKINKSHIQLVKQVKMQTQAQLMLKLDEIILQGGEGLMLHLGASSYKGRRTNDLLKLKKYNDAEAIIIKYFPGKGKYTNMLGSILVETADKKRFKIGSGFTDNERKNPPPIGSMVTYKYYGLTKNGIPRFASFLRVRKDY